MTTEIKETAPRQSELNDQSNLRGAVLCARGGVLLERLGDLGVLVDVGVEDVLGNGDGIDERVGCECPPCQRLVP